AAHRAMDSQMYERLRRQGPFAQLFVAPVGGGMAEALGAAVVAHARADGRAPATRSPDRRFCGPGYSTADAATLLRAAGCHLSDFTNRRDEMQRWLAQQLAAGQLV